MQLSSVQNTHHHRTINTLIHPQRIASTNDHRVLDAVTKYYHLFIDNSRPK